jgi:hypothetical protein
MTTAIRQLRDLVPLRPLTPAESLRIAEFQATRFLELAGVEKPPVPEAIISKLPRVHVARLTPSFASGATQWTQGRWVVVLAGSEPLGRQRYSLGHEFKHILDARFERIIYPGTRQSTGRDQVERVCDYFSACLFMPRAWVKRAYCDEGIQDVNRLARKFGVTATAMEVRLLQIGLVAPRPRCQLAVER